ncbi:MAG: alpha/beta fold hydrolase [Brevundimonas sp.]
MPALSILRFAFTLLSCLLLAIAGWLLWSWLEGGTFLAESGRVYRSPQDWRLWAAAGLIGWSLLGRFIVRLVLARADTDPSRALRGSGQTVLSDSGSILFVETLGPNDGPVVVLTHGWGLDSTIWYYAKRAMGQRFRVVVWDLAGLGRSAAAAGGLRLDAFATDLRSVIETTVPTGSVALVGHSIGGMTIQTLARDHPDFFRSRVNSVVLLNTTHTNPLRTMVFSDLARALQKPVLEPAMRLAVVLKPLLWLMAWHSYLSGGSHMAMRFGFGRFVTRSQLDHTALLATKNSPAVQARGNLSMFHWDATGSLPLIDKPTLVLAGDLDIVTKAEASRTIADLVPGASLEVIEGVNHMGFLENPEVYNDAIAEFVVRHADRPG